MTEELWVKAALTNDAMVAEFLIRMKQPSSLDSSHALSPPTTATSLLPPIRWGHRRSRSKPSSIATSNAAAASGFRKEQQSGSPTTPLCWSGGGGVGASTSDGYDESSSPSDLSSGGRSTKGTLGNEDATTSTYKIPSKRKSFGELKEEEEFLLKERLHLNKELESMRVTMNKQIATSHKLKKFKIDLGQNLGNVTEKRYKMPDDEPRFQMKLTITGDHSIQTSHVVKPEAVAHERGFVLPDLNMIPDVEEL